MKRSDTTVGAPSESLQGAGRILQEFRKSQKKTVGKVSFDAEISASSLRKIESGERNPSREAAERICRALDLTLDSLTDELSGIHDVLPKSLGRRLVMVYFRNGDVEIPAMIVPTTPETPTGESIDDWRRSCLACSTEVLDVRQATRSEKEAWAIYARSQLNDETFDYDSLADLALFSDASIERFGE